MAGWPVESRSTSVYHRCGRCKHVVNKHSIVAHSRRSVTNWCVTRGRKLQAQSTLFIRNLLANTYQELLRTRGRGCCCMLKWQTDYCRRWVLTAHDARQQIIHVLSMGCGLGMVQFDIGLLLNGSGSTRTKSHKYANNYFINFLSNRLHREFRGKCDLARPIPLNLNNIRWHCWACIVGHSIWNGGNRSIDQSHSIYKMFQFSK